MRERNPKELADGAMTEIRGLVDTLQRELETQVAEGLMSQGQSGLDVMDGVARCLHTLFAWVPYEDPHVESAQIKALQDEKKEVERQLWHSQENHKATIEGKQELYRRILRLEKAMRDVGQRHGFNPEELIGFAVRGDGS